MQVPFIQHVQQRADWDYASGIDISIRHTFNLSPKEIQSLRASTATTWHTQKTVQTKCTSTFVMNTQSTIAPSTKCTSFAHASKVSTIHRFRNAVVRTHAYRIAFAYPQTGKIVDPRIRWPIVGWYKVESMYCSCEIQLGPLVTNLMVTSHLSFVSGLSDRPCPNTNCHNSVATVCSKWAFIRSELNCTFTNKRSHTEAGV